MTSLEDSPKMKGAAVKQTLDSLRQTAYLHQAQNDEGRRRTNPNSQGDTSTELEGRQTPSQTALLVITESQNAVSRFRVATTIMNNNKLTVRKFQTGELTEGCMGS